MPTKNIYATSGSQKFKPFAVDEAAPVYSYKPQNSRLQTWALKDSAGQEHYLTDQGNWRNSQTKALSPTMPNYAMAQTAPAPVAAPPPAPSYLPSGYSGPTGTFNNAGFMNLQAQKLAAGQKITPEEYGALGGDLREYHKIYGDPAPAPAAINNQPAAQPTVYRGIMDFLPDDYKNIFSAPVNPAAPTVGNYQAPLSSQIKTFQDFMPTNFENSPAYQQAISEGDKRLSAQLAAMGKLGSGTEIEARNDLSRKVLADEVQRSMDMAGQSYQGYLGDRSTQQQAAFGQAQNQFDAQTNLNLQQFIQGNQQNQDLRNLIANFAGSDFAGYNQQQSDQAQLELQRDQQSQAFFKSLLDYQADINPMPYLFQAAQGSAENQVELGKLLAQYLGTGGGGGGSGGGGGGGGGRPYNPQPSPVTGVNTGSFLANAGAAMAPNFNNVINSIDWGSLFK